MTKDLIFILNRQGNVVATLRNSLNSNTTPFFDDLHVEELTTGAETFQFTTISKNGVAKHLVVGNYVAFKKGKKYKLFQIMQVEEEHQEELYITVYCECAGLSLINSIFRGVKIPSATFEKVIVSLLSDTGWSVGGLPLGLSTSYDLDIPQDSVYSLLQTYSQKYGVELEFRVEINRGRISKKYVDAYYNRGRVTGKRFTYDRDIDSIIRKTDSTSLYTALIGEGKNKINFRDTVVDGIDKPLGQDFVADQSSFDKYNNNGYHVMGHFYFDTESPEELLIQTYKQLQKVKNPKVEYQIGVVLLSELIGEDWGKVDIGDTISVFDNAFYPPIMVAARVSRLESSMTNKDANKCVLANFIEVQSNITSEMRKIASELEGFVEDKFNNKFPIGGEDIKDGAVGSQHIYRDSITTEHLIADCVTAEKIEAGSIESNHIKSEQIESRHIAADQIEAYHIKAGTITAESAIIADAAIGTAQIKDAEITVAKIQNAFVDSLVANQGKFQSAHIGVLTSDNIDTETIKANHISASVIDAINMNVSGKISADRIDVGSLKVEELDAGKITSGTLDANRIGANTIDVSKLTVSDMTNLATALQDAKNVNKVYTVSTRDLMLTSGFLSIADIEDNSEFVYDLYCKTSDSSTTSDLYAMLWVAYSDGTRSYPSAVVERADNARDWVKKSTTVKLSYSPGKTPVSVQLTLHVEETPPDPSSNNWDVKQVVVRRKNAGKLLVDGAIQAKHLSAGSITTEKIDAKAITANLITSSVVQAINMSSHQIDAKNIDTENLRVNGSLIAGNVSAEAIQSNVIAAINSYAGTAKIKQAQIESLKVGSANITDLDVSKLTGDKINSKLIDVDKIFIKEGNISGTLSANKIQGGTLDFNTITVTNLKADSITAGSLTIDADNKQKNTAFTKDFSNWEYIRSEMTSVNIDNVNKLENVNTANIVRTGMTSSTRYYFYSGKGTIPCGAGETFTASCYFYTTDKSLIDAPVSIGVWFYDSSKTQVGYSLTNVVFENNTWVRFTNTGKAPANSTSVAFVIAVDKNANFNIGKPMLSKGSIVPIWKPHVDEQISDGAINSDKIANEAVGVDKLNLQELFVSESGFIKKLNAVNIAANQITVGKITGDQIDMAGLISFEALDTSLQPLFDVQGNKTYINGGMIAANTIKADKIDLLSGITVQGPDNTTSLAIRNDGNVEINALLRSGNFDEEKKTGYQISPDGKAILNQAIVRGDIILPNAGITNYGAVIGNENLLQTTDYDMYTADQIMDNNLNWEQPKLLFTTISTYSHANGHDEDMHIKGRHVLNCAYKLERGISQGYINPRGTGINGQQSTEYIELKPNTSYTFSGWIYQGGGASGNCEMTVYGYNDEGQSKSKLNSQTLTSKWLGRFEFVKFTFTTDDRKYYQTRIYMNPKSDSLTEGTVQFLFYNLKLEEGDSNTPYCPSSKDAIDYVRLWAGSSFENRNDAPFRVMQNGDLYAYNANLTGVLYGEVDSGFVNIKEKELSIVDDTVLPNIEYVKMSHDRTFINTDFILGTVNDKRFDYSNSNKTININGTTTKINNQGMTLSFNDTTSWNNSVRMSSNLAGHDSFLSFGYSSGTWNNTMIITSGGSKGGIYGDVSLRRLNWSEDIDFYVEGNLRVRKSISSSKQNIEIRSIENEGWGFYAT